jgi:hypothetical protein
MMMGRDKEGGRQAGRRVGGRKKVYHFINNPGRI